MIANTLSSLLIVTTSVLGTVQRRVSVAKTPRRRYRPGRPGDPVVQKPALAVEHPLQDEPELRSVGLHRPFD